MPILHRAAALALLRSETHARPLREGGRLFILGPSGVGKTTFCRLLLDGPGGLPAVHIPASGWVRAEVPRPPDTTDDDYRALLTRHSRARLAADPDAAVRWMRAQLRQHGGCTGGAALLDGLRSPRDLMALFDPRQDTAVLLHRAGIQPLNTFEEGLGVIVAYLRWCEQNVSPERPLLLEVSLDPPARRVHHDLPAPLPGFVAERFLYDLDPQRTAWLPAEVLALSTYPEEAPTLLVRLLGDGPEHGGVFSYLPLDAFCTRIPDRPLRPLAEVVYHDCPPGPCALERVTHLPEVVQVRLRSAEETWEPGRYLASLDWYEGNSLLNLILLDSGQLAAMPFHKVKFGAGAPATLPPFRKLRQVWHAASG